MPHSIKPIALAMLMTMLVLVPGATNAATPPKTPASTATTSTPNLKALTYCSGTAAVPDYTRVGTRIFVTGTATQTCYVPADNAPFVQQLCTKIQGIYSGPSSNWVDLTNFNCNSNTGPGISASQSVDCADANRADVHRFRTYSSGSITPTGAKKQTRFAASAGVDLC